MSAIEKELTAAAKIKPKKGEDRQAYFKRLCKAIYNIKDPEWEALSVEAQDWQNDAAERLKAGDPIPEFPDSEVEGEAPEEARDEEVQPPPKSAAKASKPVRKASACHTIKTLVVKNPKISVADLEAQLKALDLKVSNVTIATLRSDMRDTLRVMNEVGVAQFEL